MCEAALVRFSKSFLSALMEADVAASLRRSKRRCSQIFFGLQRFHCLFRLLLLELGHFPWATGMPSLGCEAKLLQLSLVVLAKVLEESLQPRDRGSQAHD